MTATFLTFDYDVRAFPFQAVLASRVFRVGRLDQLHQTWRHQTGKAELVYADNLKLRALMQKMPAGSPFYALYHRWIAAFIAPKYGGKVSYSAHPKMRVHLAGTGSVSDFHCDADVTGRDDQINCFLPFTDVHGTCTIWSERAYGSGVYEPLNLRYGQALIWDGGRLKHGSVANTTNLTRVSCDFRFSMQRPERAHSPWRDVLAARPQLSPALL